MDAKREQKQVGLARLHRQSAICARFSARAGVSSNSRDDPPVAIRGWYGVDSA
jgi:hypothetical protein